MNKEKLEDLMMFPVAVKALAAEPYPDKYQPKKPKKLGRSKAVQKKKSKKRGRKS